MPWMTLKDRFNQIREGTQSYLSSWMPAKGMRLTAVASAVYHYEPLEHFRQGFSQIFLAVPFLLRAEETYELVTRSLITNIWKYLIPAILYSRFIPALRKSNLYESSPENMEYVLLLPYAAILWSMARMLQRRMETNVEYTIAYNRVVKKDIDKLLPHTLAKELANELTDILNQKFKTSYPAETIQLHLFSFLYNEFGKFFKKSNIKKDSFDELQKPLSYFLDRTINQYYLKDMPDFASQLTNEFLKIVAEDFNPTPVATKTLENLLIDESMRERLQRAKQSVQHFLPVAHYPHCSCKEMTYFMGYEIPTLEYLRRTSLAEISSIPYTLGKTIFTFLPEMWALGAMIPYEHYLALLLITILAPRIFSSTNLISQRLQSRIELAGFFSLALLFQGNFIPSQMIIGMQWIGFFARILLAGLSQLDLLISSHCTRHRTEITSRNKWYAFGIGASQTVVAEFFANINFLATNVRNVCTDLAIFALVTQMSTISTLAYRRKLPGTGENTWNLFYVPQRMMRFVLDRLNDKLQKPKPPEQLLADLQKTGKILGIYAWLTFGPGTFFPTLPIDMPKTQVQNFLLKHESLHFLLQLFRQDIEFIFSYLKQVQTITNIVYTPAPWIVQSGTLLFIAILSKLLNDKDLLQFLEKILVELKKIEIEETKKVQVIEDTLDDELTITPALSFEKVVPELTYQDKPINAETQKLLEADITNALRDNPAFPVAVKKPKPLNILSALQDSYFEVTAIKNPKVSKIDKDGYGWIESPLQKNSLLRNTSQAKKPEAIQLSKPRKVSGLQRS